MRWRPEDNVVSARLWVRVARDEAGGAGEDGDWGLVWRWVWHSRPFLWVNAAQARRPEWEWWRAGGAGREAGRGGVEQQRWAKGAHPRKEGRRASVGGRCALSKQRRPRWLCEGPLLLSS